MGLEALPGSMSANGNQTRHIKTHPDVEKNPSLGASRSTDENKQNRVPGSPRNLQKEPISPRLRNVDSVKKPIPNSKFPIETAPWRQPDGSRGSETQTLKSRITPPKAPNTSSLFMTADSEDSRKELIDKQTAKDLTPRANRLRDRSNLPSRPVDKNTAARSTKLSQTSKGPQSTTRENSSKSSGNLNLRQPHKKTGLEKQPRPQHNQQIQSGTRGSPVDSLQKQLPQAEN
ncbi:hypothetical protein GH714_012676 [Hevea brasiliensis]|uniref:Uncharacterized protein n=1 Tax=Hevea brasiliensis TaxID=3981 RepID=A0A6A6ML21_HEVBR|nr:hypothetical protein GH714_012676 [Hevea brasiliensis]